MATSCREVVQLKIVGKRDDYWFYTLRSWLDEVKDILEYEYNICIRILEEHRDNAEAPLIVDEKGQPVVLGVPEEPGYLIEELKIYLDKRVPKTS